MSEPALASAASDTMHEHEPAPGSAASEAPYRDPFEYFSHELDKLDALIALRGLERNPAAARDELERSLDAVRAAQRAIDERIAAAHRIGLLPALPWLRHRFGLSPFEEQVLLICLAPELDARYAALYNERAGAFAPTVGLVLELLCQSVAQGWRSREALEEGAPLLRWRLVERAPGHSSLADTLRVDPGVLRFVLGMTLPDPRLVEVAALELAAPVTRRRDLAAPWEQIARLIESYGPTGTDGSALVIHLSTDGRGGAVGRVRQICRDLGRNLLRVDAAALDRREADLELRLVLVLRDSHLRQAPILVEGLDALPADRARTLIVRLLNACDRLGRLVLLDGGPSVPASLRGETILWQHIEVPPADAETRARCWRQALARHAGDEVDAWAAALATRFRFEPAQIEDTAKLIELACRQAAVTLDDCFRLCRTQAAPRLGELGRLFAPRYRWTDLVLPERRRAQLEAICQSVRHHDAVFRGWGFDRKIHHGRAVSALFVGPPGTGKTMAVEIIAAELGLDVCKVDISGVVSKYIGETEQRLATVFREAWAANAVLFFDEADALFGKRTDINDARDRYANIETSYLLQRIEDYEGIVILASNLRDNIDDAFTRRLRFIVEFPSPDEAARALLWRHHLPASAPIAPDVDPVALARRFAVSGGSIRNIALRGALLAAERRAAIGMEHLIAAGLEEFEKLGKSWVPR